MPNLINMKTYKQKNLGYKRTPTTASLNVTMEDGSVYSIPVQIIADNRDEYYFKEHKDEEDTIKYIRNKSLDSYNIKGWATNNMDWKDVSEYAEKVDCSKGVDFQEGWINGEKEIVGKI